MTGKAVDEKKWIPGWLWWILLSIPLFFIFRWLFWWLLCPSYERMSAVEIDAPRRKTQVKSTVEDDLTRIKGIGPKVSRALNASGIWNFHQLAVIEEQLLKTILKEANASIVDPSTWNKQAQLAARGEWGQLEELQSRI